MNIKTRKLKRAVIKEELVELTGSMEEAVVLHQFIYWSDRVRDVDMYIREEKKRSGVTGDSVDFPLSHGWIYKKAEELLDEVMLGISANTLRKHINKLVNKGYISKRNNPDYKWDKTFQYRVNLVKVMRDLQKIGYVLKGYELLPRNSKYNTSNRNLDESSFKSSDSDLNNCGAIPEITSEITTDIISDTSSSKKLNEDEGKRHHSNQFDLICRTYLSLSKHKQLSSNDDKVIMEVVQENWDTHQIIGWIKDCFNNFKPQHKLDNIRSFQYVANYIFDQAYKLDTQEVFEDGQDSGFTIEDEYFQRFRANVSYETGEID
ncbi:hypothetical protein [Rummeliibacillus pycnus]|uniref:hypothetical protein n=1 Tax=Rummeliibacillus pycnus TaxID=101070 RepID=UPI0037CC4FF6